MTTADMTPHERVFYGAGAIDAYKLTRQQWEQKRETVARKLHAEQTYGLQPWEEATTATQLEFERMADSGLTALGFTTI